MNNLFFIGLLSFFGGIGQDIFLPLLPLYLANVLNFDKAFIGLAEGLVTAGAGIFKIVSGFLSDRFKKQKPLIFIGYFLSLIGRSLLVFVSAPLAILALRFSDGIGKGMKDPPKDVLIAASTKIETRGRGFGIVRALDTLGSVAGPLILFALLYFFSDNPRQYHYIFLITALPLLCTLSILTFRVKEVPAAKIENLENVRGEGGLPISFYIFLGIMTVFLLGNASDAFLILRAQNIGVQLLAIPVVYALFNFFYASASIPLGGLSDAIGREKVILLGWLAYAIAYLGFALASQKYQIWLLFAFYGIYYAATEGVAKAFVADITPAEHRGRAYGIYNAAVSVMALPASIIAGLLWDSRGPSAPFFFGSALSASAALMLSLFMAFNYFRSRANKQ
ncbi:MAG: MFS transporter [Parcubacteria group bacterium]|nr:MFS transporter [Parcubacteria group bacterium]